jgi:hypothetical protein
MGRRRQSGKFIPDGDSDFAGMARTFASGIAADPGRFMLSASDAAEITRAVEQFRQSLCAAIRPATRTKISIMLKHKARTAAERVVRNYGNLIRANPQISQEGKLRISVKERPRRLHTRKCPQTSPVLTFIRSTGEAGATGRKHVLRFCEQLGSGTRAKPPGAARVELFVELVAPGEPIPKHPGELSGGRPWYLRSFTRNPIEVEFPKPATPMFVVYWARWADATGEVGPWSRTCVARVEGWGATARAAALPDGRNPRQRESKCIVTVRQSQERYLEQFSSERLLPSAVGEYELSGEIRALGPGSEASPFLPAPEAATAVVTNE